MTSIAAAIAAVFNTVQPVVEEAIAQKYENAHKKRLERWSEIVARPGGPDPARVNAFVNELLILAGRPITGLATQKGTSVDCIAVPITALTALIAEISECVMITQKFNKSQV